MWGTLVWPVMTTGMRRGEVLALRWRHVHFDRRVLEIRRNYVQHRGRMIEKDTNELLSVGVDLAAVSGRLGHGGGGATTLRVYTAWVAASDQRAAEILGATMPKQPRGQPTTT